VVQDLSMTRVRMNNVSNSGRTIPSPEVMNS
jgi:hypothetical protein